MINIAKIPKIKGFGARGIGGYKMPKKSWNASEFNKEKEDKKILFIFLALLILFILLFIFMWWIKKGR